MQTCFWRLFLAFALAALIPTHLLAAEPGQTPGGEVQSVVIIPFVNLTGELADAWIGTGIGEALSTGFLPGVAILISPLSPDGDGVSTAEDSVTFQAIETGRRLGSQYVVSGAYQRLGDTLRITGRFVDLDTGSIVRSVKVDGPLTELFSLQDQVVAQLSAVIPKMAPTTPATLASAAASVSTARAGSVASRLVGFGNAFDFIDGPPPPAPPEVVSRDAQGRATVLNQVSHKFEPQGVTALALISESHVAIHTWPEVGYAAADVFSCVGRAYAQEACAYLVKALQAGRHATTEVSRGADAVGRLELEKPDPVVGDACPYRKPHPPSF